MMLTANFGCKYREMTGTATLAHTGQHLRCGGGLGLGGHARGGSSERGRAASAQPRVARHLRARPALIAGGGVAAVAGGRRRGLQRAPDQQQLRLGVAAVLQARRCRVAAPGFTAGFRSAVLSKSGALRLQSAPDPGRASDRQHPLGAWGASGSESVKPTDGRCSGAPAWRRAAAAARRPPARPAAGRRQ